MADCNCGCGTKVGFGRRGMNKNIKRTDDLLGKLEQAHEDARRWRPYPDSDQEGMERMVDGLVEEGDRYRGFWVDATHGERPQVPSEALEIKRGWNAWTRSALSISGILAASPEEQRRFVEYMRKRR
jgi:hypothetical protein